MSTDLPPMCGPEEFETLLAELVADTAPRLFAVVEEYGERVDARVVGWGLAYADHVDVIGLDGGVHLGTKPEHVLRRFGRHDRVSARVIWHGTEPA
ncbi:hypothetical protein [Actinophytocola glycyrrhizae]|uniref:Uncharacterized protein n=1 Tax=Actinophytocola glycyrrhizae TaxID=2044873 RepID=A0ABV9S9F0_9PSEU